MARKVARGATPFDAAILEEHNNLRADLETLRAAYSQVLAKLDADAGVTDADYASLHDVASGDFTAQDLNG